MLRWFKRPRSKVEKWEIDVLVNILGKLPEDFVRYKLQIEAGLLASVFFNKSSHPNLVQFSYNGAVVKEYEDERYGTFTIGGIEVYDWKSKSYIAFEMHFSDGLIIGYCTPSQSDFIPDLNNFLIKDYFKKYWDNREFDAIKDIFNAEELRLINANNVYEVLVNEKQYYHIADLQDGEFIGVDSKKNIYKITHDPMHAELLSENVVYVLSNKDRYQ